MKVSTDKRRAIPGGIKIKMMLCMAPKILSTKKKKLKFMPLGVTTQNEFNWEQYLRSFPSETFSMPTCVFV
jgi:hypothetical protein